MTLDVIAERCPPERLKRELRFLLPEGENLLEIALKDVVAVVGDLYKRYPDLREGDLSRLSDERFAASVDVVRPVLIRRRSLSPVNFVASDGGVEFDRAFEALVTFVEGYDFIAHDLLPAQGRWSERIYLRHLKAALLDTLIDDNGVYSTIVEAQINGLPNLRLRRRKGEVVLTVPFGDVSLGRLQQPSHLKRGH
jgi:hypothetical protein